MRSFLSPSAFFLALPLAATVGIGCSNGKSSPGGSAPGSSSSASWACGIEGAAPDAVEQIGCAADFQALASEPIAAAIPGARSVKTSIDRDQDFALRFQNSVEFPVHWDYVSQYRSVEQGMPRVPVIDQFNRTEYYSPSRRFLLGALTHYEGPDVWAYEVAPYDTSDADMIQKGYEQVAQATFLGDRLMFHPTSLNVERAAAALPESVHRVTTDELFQGIDFQALNLGESVGRLRFVTASELEQSYVTFRDIVVLDHVPNDITVTQGIITADYQTPLAHINVLSKNRGTPNMALRGVLDDVGLHALDGQWVRLGVTASDYSITPVDQATADSWWDEHKPQGVQVPGLDTSVTELRNVGDIVPDSVAPEDRLAAIKQGTRAFGGKAANFGALSHVPGIRVPEAFAVPVYYYEQFMHENGFDAQIAAWLADPAFQNDAAERDRRLATLRADMKTRPLNPDFQGLLLQKLASDFPGVRMRFRSSTNTEDLDGFTGAGLYTSKSGDPSNPKHLVEDAVRRVWASVWSFRAFEERSYRGIDQLAVGMALLVHRSFPDEEANGVALTNNPFDPKGLDPAFYVNVQRNEVSVVQPDPGVTSEDFLYYFDLDNQPVSYMSQSSLPGASDRVLGTSQVQELGRALDAIRGYFAPAYAPSGNATSAWWAMDVEFKFDGQADETAPLFVKQARPYGNR